MKSWRICCCPVNTAHCRSSNAGEGSGAGKRKEKETRARERWLQCLARPGLWSGFLCVACRPSQTQFPLLVAELALLMVSPDLSFLLGGLPHTPETDSGAALSTCPALPVTALDFSEPPPASMLVHHGCRRGLPIPHSAPEPHVPSCTRRDGGHAYAVHHVTMP